MKDILKEAKALKNSAKANKEIADTENDPASFDDALEDLAQARRLLDDELSSIEHKQPSSGIEIQNDYRANIARELADCFGIAGGIYRRKGQLIEAIDMYCKGYKYEKDSSYNILDSYNMTNSIVLQILNNPHSFGNLAKEIEDASNIVYTQVKGPRRKEWWAWADLGLLYVLNKEEDRALDAYREFKNNGALPKHYDSSIAVLKQLNDQLKEVAPAISASIVKAIDFLTKERSELYHLLNTTLS